MKEGDHHIASPPHPSSSKKRRATNSNSNSNRKGEEGIQLERSRREKMSELYSLLQSLVPNLFPKATRTRVVEETIAYIRYLEEMAAQLQDKKEAMNRTRAGPVQLRASERSASSSVNITASDNTVFFGILLPSQPGLAAKVLRVFDEHGADVLTATVAASDDGATTSMTVAATAMGRVGLERITAELMTF